MRKIIKYPIIIVSILLILFMMVVVGIPFIQTNDWRQTATDTVDIAMDINKTVSETINPVITQIRNDSEGLYEKRLGDIEQEERKETSILELLPDTDDVLGTLQETKNVFDETTGPIREEVIERTLENNNRNTTEDTTEDITDDISNTVDDVVQSVETVVNSSQTKTDTNNEETQQAQTSNEEELSPLDKYMQYRQAEADPNTGCTNCQSSSVTQIISANTIKIGGEIIKIANVNIGEAGAEYDSAMRIIRSECAVGTTATYDSLNTLGDGTIVAYLWCSNAQIGNITESMNSRLS